MNRQESFQSINKLICSWSARVSGVRQFSCFLSSEPEAITTLRRRVADPISALHRVLQGNMHQKGRQVVLSAPNSVLRIAYYGGLIDAFRNQCPRASLSPWVSKVVIRFTSFNTQIFILSPSFTILIFSRSTPEASFHSFSIKP